MGGRSFNNNKKKQYRRPGAKKRMERGGGLGGGAIQYVRGSYKPFYLDKPDGCGNKASVYHVYSVNRKTGEGSAECSKGGWGGFQPRL